MTLPTNPIAPGWYADPEARFYAGRAWVYATRSFGPFEDQLNLDAFSSPDLVHWDRHEAIVDMTGFPWVRQAVWAPTVAEHRGRYYLIFASNDIKNDTEAGGLEIAVSDTPQGPFRALLDRPLVGTFVHGAQPIDAHFFTDDDGTVWLYWGGWRHCCVARMNDEMTGFVPWEDGTWAREITPPDYVEAPCLLRRGDLYYFMWSSGNWTDSSYRVLYATGPSPLGPFTPQGNLLSAQPPLAEGPGHHGWLQVPGTDQWLIVYHRRPVGDPDRGHRYLCIDPLVFGTDGRLLPVVMSGRPGQDNGGPSLPYDHHEVGRPALAGTSLQAGNGFDLRAAGDDIWGTQDQFGFVHRAVIGDFDLTVRIEALEASQLYTKAGLMARDGLGAGAAHVFLLAFPTAEARNNNSGLFEAQYRAQGGGDSTAVYPPNRGRGEPEFPAGYPQVWLRLTRRGDDWTCLVGSEGGVWQTYAAFSLALPARLEVGPAATSHEGSKRGLARFRDLTLRQPG